MGKCVIHRESCQRNKVGGLFGHFGDESFMTIADDRVDAGQLGDLLRCALGVASCDQDARGGVFAVHSSQESAGGAIRLGSHAAGIGDDHVGAAGV